MADFGDTEAEQEKSMEAVRDESAKAIWLADALFHHYAETTGGGLALGEPEPLGEGATGAQTGARDDRTA